jgi:hypothetical protein
MAGEKRFFSKRIKKKETSEKMAETTLFSGGVSLILKI